MELPNHLYTLDLINEHEQPYTLHFIITHTETWFYYTIIFYKYCMLAHINTNSKHLVFEMILTTIKTSNNNELGAHLKSPIRINLQFNNSFH
jgi:hypothetical protein